MCVQKNKKSCKLISKIIKIIFIKKSLNMTHVFICVRHKFECLSGMTQPNPIFLKVEGEIYLEIAIMVLRTRKKLQFVKLIYILFEVMVPHNYKADFFFLLLASDFKLFFIYI